MEMSHMAPRKLLVTSCWSWYLPGRHGCRCHHGGHLGTAAARHKGNINQLTTGHDVLERRRLRNFWHDKTHVEKTRVKTRGKELLLSVRPVTASRCCRLQPRGDGTNSCGSAKPPRPPPRPVSPAPPPGTDPTAPPALGAAQALQTEHTWSGCSFEDTANFPRPRSCRAARSASALAGPATGCGSSGKHNQGPRCRDAPRDAAPALGSGTSTKALVGIGGRQQLRPAMGSTITLLPTRVLLPSGFSLLVKSGEGKQMELLAKPPPRFISAPQQLGFLLF